MKAIGFDNDKYLKKSPKQSVNKSVKNGLV